MYNNPQYHELQPGEKSRLVSRIVLLVVYLFLASVLSLSVVTSAFASDRLYDENTPGTVSSQIVAMDTRERFSDIKKRFGIEKISFHQAP
jgi:hypothetical protein